MEIRIPLNVGISSNTYKELKSQLKQLELSVHHAQKAVESAKKKSWNIRTHLSVKGIRCLKAH
jgi:flagellar biosynthesis chaperone FliJ